MVLETKTILQMFRECMVDLNVMSGEQKPVLARSVEMKEREGCMGTQWSSWIRERFS